MRWGVTVVSEGGGQTIAEVNAAARNDLIGQAAAHPFVIAALEAFPGAEISDVRVAATMDPIDDVVPIDTDDDDWDPFDPFEEES